MCVCVCVFFFFFFYYPFSPTSLWDLIRRLAKGCVFRPVERLGGVGGGLITLFGLSCEVGGGVGGCLKDVGAESRCDFLCGGWLMAYCSCRMPDI